MRKKISFFLALISLFLVGIDHKDIYATSSSDKGLVIIEPAIAKNGDRFKLYYIREDKLSREDHGLLYEDLSRKSEKSLDLAFTYRELYVNEKKEIETYIEKSGLYYIYDGETRRGDKNVNALVYLKNIDEGNLVFLKLERPDIPIDPGDPDSPIDPKEAINIGFRKKWDGNKEKEAIIHLKGRVGNNYVYQKDVVLNEDNEWFYMVEGLSQIYEGDLEYYRGETIIYEINEKIVEGYESSIEKKEGVYEITNRYLGDKPGQPPNPEEPQRPEEPVDPDQPLRPDNPKDSIEPGDPIDSGKEDPYSPEDEGDGPAPKTGDDYKNIYSLIILFAILALLSIRKIIKKRD